MKITYWEGEAGKKTTFEENYATKKKNPQPGDEGVQNTNYPRGGGALISSGTTHSCLKQNSWVL